MPLSSQIRIFLTHKNTRLPDLLGRGNHRRQRRQPLAPHHRTQAVGQSTVSLRAAPLRAIHLRRSHPLYGGQTAPHEGTAQGKTAQDADDRSAPRNADADRRRRVPDWARGESGRGIGCADGWRCF